MRIDRAMAENVPEKQCKVRFATARTNPKPSICWGRKSPTLQKNSWKNYIVKKEKYLYEKEKTMMTYRKPMEDSEEI